MKILKGILLTFAGIIALMLIISFFLPNKSHVERSIIINTTATVPYNYVNNLKEWKKWSPWHGIDTTAVWEYSEVAQGDNAWYTWKSENPNVGNGKLTILETKKDEFIKTKLEFEGMGTSMADYTFVPENDAVKVTWSLDSDHSDMPWYMIPMSKYFGLFMDKMIGPDYEKGLKALKELSEANPQIKIAGFNAEFRDLPAMQYVGVREYIKFEKIGEKLGEYYSGMMGDILKQNQKPTGQPFTINYKVDEFGVDMEAAIPVNADIKTTGKAKKGSLIASKAFVVQYYGDYMNTAIVYDPAYAYLAQNNFKPNGAPMEFYITDPGMEKDTAKWLTEVVIPIE